MVTKIREKYIQKQIYFVTDFLILVVLGWLVVILHVSVKISTLPRKNDVFLMLALFVVVTCVLLFLPLQILISI